MLILFIISPWFELIMSKIGIVVIGIPYFLLQLTLKCHGDIFINCNTKLMGKIAISAIGIRYMLLYKRVTYYPCRILHSSFMLFLSKQWINSRIFAITISLLSKCLRHKWYSKFGSSDIVKWVGFLIYMTAYDCRLAL